MRIFSPSRGKHGLLKHVLGCSLTTVVASSALSDEEGERLGWTSSYQNRILSKSSHWLHNVVLRADVVAKKVQHQ